MTITRTRLLILAIAGVLLYWMPATWFPDAVRSAVNASYFLLSVMMIFILVWDVVDIVRTEGRGMSWQAAVGKIGLFLMALFFCGSRIWGLLLGIQNYPEALLHSPLGGFLTYGQGIGFGFIVWCFSAAGDAAPRITTRGTIIVACGSGIIIGIALSHLPFGG